jgi:hypothetical protein
MVGVVSFDIMREFFHGWRRKAGVMTLVVALSAAGVWVRASVLCEQIDIQIGHRHHMITLAHDGLAWLSMDGHLRRGWIHHGYMAEDVTAVGAAKIWMRRGNAMERSPSGWIIRYWSVVLPLTLLSASLILWKPRKPASAN